MAIQGNELAEVIDIIGEIARKSNSSDFIYRGEPKCYPTVSSSLYREAIELGISDVDVEVLQRADLADAERYTHETDDFTILTELSITAVKRTWSTSQPMS